METKNIVSWVLLISTFLIAGRALKLIDISWAIAFAPFVLLAVSFLIIFFISFAYMYKTISKNEDKDEK
jgi:hypothetical protein